MIRNEEEEETHINIKDKNNIAKKFSFLIDLKITCSNMDLINSEHCVFTMKEQLSFHHRQPKACYQRESAVTQHCSTVLNSSPRVQTNKTMPGHEADAENKFWRTPELLERLLIFLDVKSILCLARCHQFTVNVLQGTSVWKKLIRRICPEGLKLVRHRHQIPCDAQSMKKRLDPQRKELLHLVEILKMFEDPQPHLCALLDLIAERFPPFQDGPRMQHNPDRDEENNESPPMDLNSLYGAQLVQVACRCCQKTHTVSPLGFLIMDEVENAFGTTEQKIEGIVMDSLEEPWLTILRLRQQEAMERFDTHTVRCDDSQSIEVVASLIQRCPNINLRVLKIRGEIGAEGWSRLAKALRGNPEAVKHIDTNKSIVLAGGRKDLREIWESLGPRGSWSVLGNGWASFFRQGEKVADENINII